MIAGRFYLGSVSINKSLNSKDRSKTDFLEKKADRVVMPRISISYSAILLPVFVSAAKRHSPLPLAEIRPSSNEYNKELLPEQGWNYELGYKIIQRHGLYL